MGIIQSSKTSCTKMLDTPQYRPRARVPRRAVWPDGLRPAFGQSLLMWPYFLQRKHSTLLMSRLPGVVRPPPDKDVRFARSMSSSRDATLRRTGVTAAACCAFRAWRSFAATWRFVSLISSVVGSSDSISPEEDSESSSDSESSAFTR